MELIKEGKSLDDIMKELRVSREEVKGMLEILKALDYIEEVEAESCNNCPLKEVCGGGCVRIGIKAYVPKFKS